MKTQPDVCVNKNYHETPKVEEKGRGLDLRFDKVMVNLQSLRIRYQEEPQCYHFIA